MSSVLETGLCHRSFEHVCRVAFVLVRVTVMGNGARLLGSCPSSLGGALWLLSLGESPPEQACTCLGGCVPKACSGAGVGLRGHLQPRRGSSGWRVRAPLRWTALSYIATPSRPPSLQEHSRMGLNSESRISPQLPALGSISTSTSVPNVPSETSWTSRFKPSVEDALFHLPRLRVDRITGRWWPEETQCPCLSWHAFRWLAPSELPGWWPRCSCEHACAWDCPVRVVLTAVTE